MIVQRRLPKWEEQLLMLAEEAYNHSVSLPLVSNDWLEEANLRHAYLECALITRQYSRSFHLASALLPNGKRQAVRALYGFCRTADNIVDGGSNNPEADLRQWKYQSLYNHEPKNHPVALAWTDTRARYKVPLRYGEQLIEGLEKDLTTRRYESFEELSVYCYGVASTVGLMSMHIIGFEREEALPYAIKLGVALQLTNILRDVGEDLRAGRIYLPLDELREYGLEEKDLLAGTVDKRWRNFMRYQIERNRRLYAEAAPGIEMLNPDGRFAVASAAALYQGILDDIEAHGYDVFSRRAHVGKWGKLRLLAGVYGKR